MTGKQIACHIDRIALEHGIVANAPDYLKSLDLGRHFALVADDNTYPALGEKLHKALASLGKIIYIPLGSKPVPDEEFIARIRKESAACDALIAVGSGTINDLCKYASFLDGKPYAVFASAPSMNGYASANASITISGHKQSLPAHLPKGLFFDLDVMAEAPRRLINSGLGDALCRSTAQADWLLSHLLLDTPYDETPFQLLAPYEAVLLEESAGLIKGDAEIVKQLVMTLILSGMGMVIAGGSYPASQGEHLIAHTMEMVNGNQIPHTFHGEQIGVTALTMAHMQENLLRKLPELKYKPIDEEAIAAFFGAKAGPSIIKEFKKKALSQLKIKKLNQILPITWETIADRIHQHFIPYGKLQKALQNVRGVTTIEQLGWSVGQYSAAVRHAHYIRNRFTFLDLAYLVR